jgi:hypothetical protein
MPNVRDIARWLLIAAQLVLAVIYASMMLSSHLPMDSDFVSFYTGWSIVRDGDGARIYDLELQGTYQAQLLDTGRTPPSFELLPFINPPHALVFMPFGFFSPAVSAWVFLSFNLIVAAWIMRRLWQLTTSWTRDARILLFTTILATEVFWYSLATRTLTIIVFAFLIEYYLALRERRDGRAAVWLIAATVKPQLIFLPALIPLARGRWRLVGIACVLGLIIGLAVSLMLGFQIWLEYFRLLREVSTHGELYGATPLLMNNLRMILHRTVPEMAVSPLVYLALLGGIAVVFWLWRSAGDFDLRFALTVLLGLLLAPHLNYQDTVVTILPAVIGYEFTRQKGTGFAPLFPVLIIAASFVPPALIFSGYARTLRWIWPLPIILVLTLLYARMLYGKERDRNYSEV